MPNVLVVDDSPIDRTLIEGVLKRDPRMKTRTAVNGADALSRVAEFNPEVLVTDLQMPEMDGLQLVTAMRIHYPRVPVVLITAHGSEELAIRALEQGASSYVPKSQLANKLLEAVDEVLSLAQADRSYEQLAACMDEARFQFTLDCDPPLLSRLVELIQQIVISMGLCDVGGQVRLGMALEEALRLAMYRGNLELTDEDLARVSLHRGEGQQLVEERKSSETCRGRKLRVRAELSPERATIVIQHEGRPLQLPLATDDAPALEGAGDRSVILMRAFLDEVTLSPDGRELTLRKNRAAR